MFKMYVYIYIHMHTHTGACEYLHANEYFAMGNSSKNYSIMEIKLLR